MNSYENKTVTRQAAINGLAVVGFVALIAAGFALAVYSTRFVPTVVNGAGSAAVYLSSFFLSDASLSVVSAPPVTIFFGEATSTTPVNSVATSSPASSVKPTAGTKTDATYQISGATSTPALSGFPDLIVTIQAIGYLNASSSDSFVASSTVPAGMRPAVSFTIKNVGTNATGAWRFSASIPTSSNPIYQSNFQQSLNPGDYIEYTLGFTQAVSGADKMISVTVNFDHAVTESNFNNNSASAKVTILGS